MLEFRHPNKNMNEETKGKFYKSLVGPKDTIISSCHARVNCHFNIGESLSYLRERIITELDEHERELAEKTIGPLEFSVPRKGDLGVWTVSSTEAYRLYCQLEPLVLPSQTYNKVVKKSRSTDQSDSGKRVFLVHGHDEASREMVDRFLEKLELTPMKCPDEIAIIFV